MSPEPEPPRVIVPERPRQWAEMLDQLAEQLADKNSRVCDEIWDHRRLAQSLMRALNAFDAATPGGMASFRSR